MRERGAGVPASEIPEAEQWELVNLVWDAPEDDVVTVGPVEPAGWRHDPEGTGVGRVCPQASGSACRSCRSCRSVRPQSAHTNARGPPDPKIERASDLHSYL